MAEQYDGVVCVVCVMAIANGDLSMLSDSEAQEWADRVEALDACEGGKFYVALGDSSDAFSRSRCDYCGDRFEGYRHAVAFVQV